MKHTDLAKDYFERHSLSNECHISSDGRVFHTFGHATSFVQENDLQDKHIESYKRKDVATTETANENETFVDSELQNLEAGGSHQKDLTKTDADNVDAGSDTESQNLEADGSHQEDPVDTKTDSKIEELKNTDIETADYNTLKAFVKHFNIETADQKSVTLKAALAEYQNTLNTLK